MEHGRDGVSPGSTPSDGPAESRAPQADGPSDASVRDALAITGSDRNRDGAERRDNVAPRMAVDVSVVRDIASLQAIEAEWRALAGMSGGALFRGPEWLIPWWQAYHATLGAELYVLVGRAPDREGRELRDGEPGGAAPGEIVCLAPLYRRTVKVALLDTRELRMIGDA